jgi:bacterioferritin
MRGEADIIEALNDILTAELTGINQYFLHAKLCANWGYRRLAHQKREESMEEMRHADALMDRIIYLEGLPNMQRLYTVRVGEDPVEQHQLDLELERDAVGRLNAAIALCSARGDHGTRTMLEPLLKGEEDSVDWLETQLRLISELGKERYLAQQLHKD